MAMKRFAFSRKKNCGRKKKGEDQQKFLMSSDGL
jgi:hypothetical protein